MRFDTGFKITILIILVLMLGLFFKSFFYVVDMQGKFNTQSCMYRRLNDKFTTQLENYNISKELINYSEKLIDKYHETQDNSKSVMQFIENNFELLINELNLTKQEKDELQDILINKTNRIDNLNLEIQSMLKTIQNLKDNISDIQIKIPTYYEVKQFIEVNEVDKRTYIPDEYVCYHFAMDLCNDAFMCGYKCAYVQIRYPDWHGHAVVAFETSDRGLIYIEPQNDNIINIYEGATYLGEEIEEIILVW